MATVFDASGATGLREELIRQQIAIAAMQLIVLNNVKQANEYRIANDKINEQKEFNNILFTESIIEEEIKILNSQMSMLASILEKLKDNQLAEDIRKEEQQRRALQEEDFFIRVAVEKDLFIKKQMLLNKINEVDEKLQKMISVIDRRIEVLDTAIAANNIQNKNYLENILTSVDYNNQQKEFDFRGRKITLGSREITDEINNKLSEKIEDETLTIDNFFSSVREIYREVIENKLESLGMSKDEYRSEIDSLIENDYIELEKQIQENASLLDLQNGLEHSEALAQKRDENILRRDLLVDEQAEVLNFKENIEQGIADENAQLSRGLEEALQMSLERIASLETIENAFLDFDDDLDEDLDINNVVADEDEAAPDEPNDPAQDGPVAQAGPPGGPAVDYTPEEPEPNIDPNPVENNAQPQQPAAQKPKTSTGALSKMLGINLAAKAAAENNAAPDNLDNQEKKSEAKQSPANAQANQADAKRDEDVRPSGPRR